MFRTAVLILSGNAFGSLMLLMRNLAIARLVSIEDYGIAATFAISMAVVEMASGLGLQQLIVQDKNGDDPALQAGLQGFNLLRSLVSGVALFLLAMPIARFLGIPEIAWAYQLLALVPVLRGFEHFDIYRLNRKMQFKPLILTKTVPALISVLSVWPLYQVYGDYRVMLYAVLIQWALVALTSHLVAERRYQLSFGRAVMVQGLRFGWPLLINNILLFAVFQGDKLIVGRELGMETLAIFAMGFTLTLTPTLVTATSEKQFFLPQLSSAVQDQPRFSHLSLVAMQTSLVSGLTLVVAMCLLGPLLVKLLLGAKYVALTALLPWLAILQAVRVFKVGGTVAALAKTHTSNAMFANSLRVLMLPAGWYVATHGGNLLQIIWIAILGEFFAYVVSFSLVSYRLQLNVRAMLIPLLACVIVIAAAAAQAIGPLYTGYPPVWGALIVAGLFLMSLTTMKELRSYLTNRMQTTHLGDLKK